MIFKKLLRNSCFTINLPFLLCFSANTKLEQQTKIVSSENIKLKAQIKREEIHKNAVQEELLQKKKENEELVKICDELISGQRS